jgi:MoxR-like ATPase
VAYTKLIDPESPVATDLKDRTFRPGDRRTEPVYVYDERITLALNVAVVTGRPLLIAGEAGTGKSSLAFHLSKVFGWRLYTQAVSSRTQARDLQWTFDSVRRLNDAQAHEVRPRPAYVEPGVLWWAFNRESALRRGLEEEQSQRLEIDRPSDPCVSGSEARAIVLLDEIDKADPDVPNDLLEPLASYRFRCDEVGATIQAEQVPLVVITTNEERDLARAFLRRCVFLRLPAPDRHKLLQIARVHFPDGAQGLHELVADRFFGLREQSQRERVRPPSTAEYLDALGACQMLRITDEAGFMAHWSSIAELTLMKPQASESHR